MMNDTPTPTRRSLWQSAGGLLLLCTLGGCEFAHKVNPVGPSRIQDYTVGGATVRTTATARTVNYPDTIIGARRAQPFEVVIDTLWADDDLEIDLETDNVDDAFDVSDTCDLDSRWESPTPKRCVVKIEAFRPPPNAAPGSVISKKIYVSRLEDGEIWNTGEIVISGRAIAPAPFSVAVSALDFGGVAVGDTKALTVRVSADLGDTAVVVELLQPGERFAITDNGCEAGMSRGESCLIEVEFDSDGIGVVHEAELRLTLPGAASPFSIRVRGVSLGEQTITFDELEDREIGSRPVPLVARSTSGLPVTFTSQTPGICTVAGSQALMVAPGTCRIAADQAGNGSFAAAETETQEFEIEKHSQNIDVEPIEDQPLSDERITIVATVDSGLPLTYRSGTPAVCSVAGIVISMDAIGTCRVIVAQAGNNVYEEASETVRFEVTKPGEPEEDPDMDGDGGGGDESGDTRVRPGKKAKPPVPVKKKGL
jgi:hypothetical protein